MIFDFPIVITVRGIFQMITVLCMTENDLAVVGKHRRKMHWYPSYHGTARSQWKDCDNIQAPLWIGGDVNVYWMSSLDSTL